ncbi:MAG: cytochrome P450 [Burkholderiales bacterium]
MDSSNPSTIGFDPPAAQRQWADLPGPRSWPLVGNAFQLDAASVHLQLEQWCREFGPYFKLRVGRPILVVGDHKVVASVLRNRPEVFQRTPRLNQIWTEMGLKPGLFGANGDAWRHQRRMVMASFDPAHVRRYFPSLRQVADRLGSRWQKAARAGASIDLQADLMRYTVDTIAGLAFGSEVNTLESDGDVIQQHLDRIFPAVSTRVIAPIPVWRWWRRAKDRQLDHSVVEVNAAVERFIGAARARMQVDPALRERPSNLLEAMLAAADAPESGIDDDQVAGNVVTMLLAGEDTTANTIAWMIELLWRHPEALERAMREVRQTAGGSAAPDIEQIEQLDFIEACAHETMRLKPVAPVLPFMTEGEITVGDVQVPAGTIVICLMRRDSVSEQHVPNAEVFQPERWLADGGPAALAGSAKRVSMPFGAGPRICPGRYLALLEIKMAMATLLGRFDIEDVSTPDGKPAREHLSFTMTPVGLRMRLRERGG